MPAATVATGAKPHGQQQLARDLEVERAVIGYAASGKVGLVSLSLIHISEPTRLGMISYAVFCLKKKTDRLSVCLS